MASVVATALVCIGSSATTASGLVIVERSKVEL